MTEDLISWLRERLDADEQAALAAAHAVAEHTYAKVDIPANLVAARRWTSKPWLYHRVVRADGPPGWEPKVTDSVWAEVGVLVAAWDPARVLDEVTAKRKLVGFAEGILETETSDLGANLLLRHAAEIMLEQLAMPYADQPGYRDEWRPDQR